MDIRSKLDKLIKGDMKYFEDIYIEYYDKVYFIALSVLKNEQDSEDITQEVFTQVYKSINNLDDIDKFNAWISRIALSKSIDSIRKKKRINDKESYCDYDFHNVDSGENIESNLIEYERNKFILDLIQQLPEKKRIVLSLFYYNELKIDQIAEILDCPLGTVKSRLNSAKKDLKVLLAKQEQDTIKLYGLTLPALLMSIKFIKFNKGNVSDIYIKSQFECSHNNVNNSKSNILGNLNNYKKIIYTMIISSSCIVSASSSIQNIDVSTNSIEDKVEINNSIEDANDNENITDESESNTGIKKTLKYLVTDSNGNTTVKTRTITIVEDKPPQIFGADDITIKKGEAFDYSEGVYVKDDNDIQIDTSINGFVDTNTVGKYELEYIAKDSNGNITKKIRKIEVKN